MINDVSKLINEAKALRAEGNLEDAEKAYLECLVHQPSNHIILHLYAGLLVDLQRFNEAAIAAEQSIGICLSDPNQLIRIGFALWKAGSFDRAHKANLRALSMDPKCLGGYFNLAGILCDQGQVQEAINVLNQGIHVNPNNPLLTTYLGNLFKQTNCYTEAEQAYLKVLDLQPEMPQAREGLAEIYTDQARYTDALKVLEGLWLLNPDYNNGKFQLSLMLLRLKDFANGWKLYENRFTGDWKSNGLVDRSDLFERKSRYSEGKAGRLLVLSEQGIGDQIMFLSMTPELSKNVDELLIQCDERLHSLLRRSLDSGIRLLNVDESPCLTEYDYELPMGSLGMTHRNKLDSFSNSSSGYLSCDTDRQDIFRKRLEHANHKLIVGISWKSALDRPANKEKSLSLQELLSSIVLPDIIFVNLQYGDIWAEWNATVLPSTCSKIAISDLDNQGDIDGLAALIKVCDIIITIDNITAHLAGSLGASTLLLLPFCSDWRWGVDDSSSYWYASLRLIRQQTKGVWDDPLREVKGLLARYLE